MSSNRSAKVDSQDPAPGPRNRTWAIFVVSVLGLFLEMLLIRWIGTEIRIFAYLQNTVLVVCFLGLGMGCFTCHKPVQIRRQLLVPLLFLTLILAVPMFRNAVRLISDLLSELNDFLIWYHAINDGPFQTTWRVGLGLLMTFGLMLLIWEMFVPLGRLLGRLMNDHPNTIWAYSVNVGGSLIGIWLFVLLSAFSAPPVVWFLVAAGLLWLFLGRGRQRNLNVGLLGVIVLLSWLAGREPGAVEVAWSPYQKLALWQTGKDDEVWAGHHLIAVNNTGYQGLIDLSPEAVKTNKRIEPEMRGLSQYDIPLLLHPNPKRVLAVGAGSGNDAAGALRGGAEHVTAVEIDPAIIDLGRRYHAEQPYASPKVKVVNDDARSFFATTNEKFDLIIFGLLDSHTMTAMTNARLDHYVYTRESIARAKTLLSEGGVMVLSFEAVKPYIADRMARCLRDAFGYEPLTFRIPSGASGWGGVMFVTGDADVFNECLRANPRLSEKIAQWQAEQPIPLTYTARVTTDDWPYVYLESPRIPTLYFLLVGLMGALLVYCTRRLKTPGLMRGWTRSHWHFFFLGAAFLLLEVQNISKAAVVLGNTWWVNAVIISGILLMILLANFIAAKWPKLPQDAVTICLIGSCVGLFYFDVSRFGFLPYFTKAAIVGSLTTLPMLFSGIIFIRSFAQVERKDLALGANLLGALVGGLLQSVTFIIGIKALLLIVAGLYMVAMLTRPRVPRRDSTTDKMESAPPLDEELVEAAGV